MRGRTDAGSAVLAGQRILAVEDDFLVLLEIATVLSNAGAVVVKCTTVEQALQTLGAERFTAAVLDVRIGRDTIAPVARRLTDLGTPFLFYTGQVQSETTIEQWPQIKIVSKPALAAVLVRAVTDLLQSSAKPRARDR
jgi:DNA-binding response OmpR family regulator